MNQNYLIPANTKRGQLIFGLFTPIDLTIFLSGLIVTFLLVMFLPMEILWVAILAITPGIICALLCAPIAHYHNVRQLLIELYQYFTKRNRFVWKGWCYLDESKDESK